MDLIFKVLTPGVLKSALLFAGLGMISRGAFEYVESRYEGKSSYPFLEELTKDRFPYLFEDEILCSCLSDFFQHTDFHMIKVQQNHAQKHQYSVASKIIVEKKKILGDILNTFMYWFLKYSEESITVEQYTCMDQQVLEIIGYVNGIRFDAGLHFELPEQVYVDAYDNIARRLQELMSSLKEILKENLRKQSVHRILSESETESLFPVKQIPK